MEGILNIVFGGIVGALAATGIQIYYNGKNEKLKLAVDIVTRIDRFRWHIYVLKETLIRGYSGSIPNPHLSDIYRQNLLDLNWCLDDTTLHMRSDAQFAKLEVKKLIDEIWSEVLVARDIFEAPTHSYWKTNDKNKIEGIEKKIITLELELRKIFVAEVRTKYWDYLKDPPLAPMDSNESKTFPMI